MTQYGKTHILRNTFFTGLVILIPLFVTYLLISFLFDLFSAAGAGMFQLLSLGRFAWVEPLAPFVNLFFSLVVIFLLGLVGTNIVGRRMLKGINALLMRLPLVSSIYGTVKEMVETFHGPTRSFQRVVLVKYPQKGFWMMGLVACERDSAMNLFSSEKILSVFIPTTPNPTSGLLVLVSPEDVVDLDYTVEDAFKFVMSSGIIGKSFAPALTGNGA